MKANKGFTLLEVAVVLAVIAILAAMLTPIVTSYIDQARVTRAQNDVKKIAESVLLYKRDTGVYPGFNLLADARIGTTGTITGNLKDCLITGPSTSTTLTGFGCGTNVGFLAAFLNVNSIGLSSTNLNNSTGGTVGYRGPYLDGLDGLDPWGNPYVVNSSALAVSSSTVGAFHAFAVSAGPNATFDTTKDQSGVVTFASDDIGSQID